MLLRSSSTPILGSLPSSESPNNNPLDKIHSPFSSENPKKLSFSHGINTAHHPNSSPFHSFSCHLTQPPDSLDRAFQAVGGFRRARSDGNLEALMSDVQEDLHRPTLPPPPIRTNPRRPSPIIESVASLSVYNHWGGQEEEEEEEEPGDGGEKDGLERSVTFGESIGGEFCFVGEKGDVGFGGKSRESPLFLARGLGIDASDPYSYKTAGSGGGGGGGGFHVPMPSGGDQSDMEAYYRRMVEENPCSALVMRNYAQFLYQIKGDLRGAEDYYSRAILAEPGDGEVLSQYAKLVWELHRDHERALNYFEQAVQSAPNDSHVIGAYANFLWEIEDEPSDGRENAQSQNYSGASVSYGAMASASA